MRAPRDFDNLIVRKIHPSDADRIRELTIEGFDGVSIDQNSERLFGTGPYPAWRERKWAGVRDQLDMHPADHFVAELDSEVVGYITTGWSAETRIGRIPDMAVDARHRRHGIGSRLIERALAHLLERGMTLAKIETLEQNAAGESLYPKHGFVEVARQIHFMRRLDDQSG
jgi:ribosomal protein S18 acetylase RimI-like enzyme